MWFLRLSVKSLISSFPICWHQCIISKVFGFQKLSCSLSVATNRFEDFSERFAGCTGSELRELCNPEMQHIQCVFPKSNNLEILCGNVTKISKSLKKASSLECIVKCSVFLPSVQSCVLMCFDTNLLYTKTSFLSLDTDTLNSLYYSPSGTSKVVYYRGGNHCKETIGVRPFSPGTPLACQI